MGRGDAQTGGGRAEVVVDLLYAYTAMPYVPWSYSSAASLSSPAMSWTRALYSSHPVRRIVAEIKTGQTAVCSTNEGRYVVAAAAARLTPWIEIFPHNTSPVANPTAASLIHLFPLPAWATTRYTERAGRRPGIPCKWADPGRMHCARRLEKGSHPLPEPRFTTVLHFLGA